MRVANVHHFGFDPIIAPDPPSDAGLMHRHSRQAWPGWPAISSMYSIIDLSVTLKPGMRGVAVAPAYLRERDGWNAANWSIYSHAGTHVDAKIHFGVSPATIDTAPLESFCGRAWVAHIENVLPSQLLSPADLGPVARKVQPGDCLLLHTGWSCHIDDPAVYRDQLPRIDKDLANWLVDARVRLVGVEGPSVAAVHDIEELTEIHTVLLEAGVMICEGLCNLDRLGERTFFMALPLKLHRGDGAPVRAVAIEGLFPA